MTGRRWSVIARWSRQLAGGRRPARRSRSSRRETTGLEHLTDRELIRAWSRTSQELAVVSDPVRRLTLVHTRQYLLDELWRRDLWATGSWPHHDVRLPDGARRLDP